MVNSTFHSELQQHLCDGRPVLTESPKLSSCPFVDSLPETEAYKKGENVSSGVGAGGIKGSRSGSLTFENCKAYFSDN